jgi:hypothetical protein
MSMMEKMMQFMMGRMSKEDKEEMMDKMMGEFFAGMTVKDKQDMMAAMMPKMMEGMNFMEMMPRMMMGMTGGSGAKGCMPGAIAEAGEREEGTPMAAMMPTMMTEMMPRCLEMMLPHMPQEARTDFVLKMIGTLVEQGTAGLSEAEKTDLSARASEKLEATLRRPNAA